MRDEQKTQSHTKRSAPEKEDIALALLLYVALLVLGGSMIWSSVVNPPQLLLSQIALTLTGILVCTFPVVIHFLDKIVSIEG